jgi:hypothetical protein
MRLPESVAPRGDLGVLSVSCSETISVRKETFAGETEVGRDELAVLGGESCALEFGEADEARVLDENMKRGLRSKLLTFSILDGRWCL